MSREVVIDWDDCIGCGNCESICPEVFRVDEESGKAEAILAEGGPEERVEDAMENCPVECIHWEK